MRHYDIPYEDMVSYFRFLDNFQNSENMSLHGLIRLLREQGEFELTQDQARYVGTKWQDTYNLIKTAEERAEEV